MDISIGSYKFRLEILILIVVVFWIMFGHMLCSCCKISMFEGMQMMKEGMQMMKEGLTANNQQTTTTEGFVGANNVASGPEFASAKSPDYIMNPSTWSTPTLTYSPGTKPNASVKAIWNRPKQPIPLPEGQLVFWATTPFKPECCPSYLSTSTGCACMTVDQYNYLIDRGGNNVPHSEY